MQPTSDLRCEVCGAQFASQRELEEHEIQAHEAHYPGYRCPICHTQFASREQLDEHSRQQHPLKE